MKRISLVVFFIAAFFCGEIQAQVQWRGPERNGKYPDTGLLKEWPDGGPELILKKDGLGGGYSTPVMYEGIIYITGRMDSLEYLSAVTLDGKLLWQTLLGKAWMQSFQETRNTPTIENGRVYISATMGNVNCIDAKTGEVIWATNPNITYGGIMHKWGTAESLLLTEDAVLVSPAGEQTIMVALNKDDGSLIWKTEPAKGTRTYVSPLMIEFNGIKVILATTSEELVGINPDNGEIFFRQDLITDYTDRGRRILTNTPLYDDGNIFISSGYQDTAAMFQLSDDCRSLTEKWRNGVLDNHHGGLVLVDGYIYGSNWISNGKGNWVCLDWDTGEVMYEKEWHNKGQIIWADGMLYLVDEKMGNIGLFPPTPDGLEEISSFQVSEGRGPRWAHPSIYDGKLLFRHYDVLLVYDIKQ